MYTYKYVYVIMVILKTLSSKFSPTEQMLMFRIEDDIIVGKHKCERIENLEI